jgi:hypothetical protein
MSAHSFIVTELVVAGAAVVWAAMLPAAAYAAALPADRSAAQVFAFAVYALGSAICHQRDERSFHLFAEQFPVCARCTGLYAGAAIAAIWYVGLFRRRESGPGLSGVEGPRPGGVDGVPSKVAETGTARCCRSAAPMVALPVRMDDRRRAIQHGSGRNGDRVRRCRGLRHSGCGRFNKVNYRSVRDGVAEDFQTGALVLLCVAAWAIPGAGHLWLGRRAKGLVFLVAIPLMFAVGLALSGRLFPSTSASRSALQALADLGIGVAS